MKIKEGKLEKYGLTLNTLEVELPHTTLLIIEGFDAFVMCGALDVNIYNSPRMIERKVICAKAIGVKTIEQLFNAPIYEACNYAQSLGLVPGMMVYEFFEKLSQKE